MKSKTNPWAAEVRGWAIGKSAFVCLKPSEEKALVKSLPSVIDRATFCKALAPYVDARTLGQMADISEGRLKK